MVMDFNSLQINCLLFIMQEIWILKSEFAGSVSKIYRTRIILVSEIKLLRG